MPATGCSARGDMPDSAQTSPFHFCGPLLESLADGVFAVDREWRIVAFNRAAEQITGMPREEALGQICCEVFKASICETRCALRQVMTTGRPVIDRAIFILNSEGRQIPVSISAAVLRDDSGAIIGGVETFRDLSQVETLRRELEKRFSFHDIVSRSPKMQDIFDILPALAESRSTVLITGESGTGKELVARAVHTAGPDPDAPFIAVNCGALPDTLLESELFGYRKGAFTDARQDKPGRFALAENGTIFLDEIGDISPAVQVKLLRVLQEGVYEPLGAVKPEKSRARIITATHRNLDDYVRENQFREDLFYRINVVNIHLPPLRERPEDIPLLVDHFIHHFNTIQNKHIQGMADDAMSILIHHPFPGNVRELRNIIERAFILCRAGFIRREHFPETLSGSRSDALPDQGMTLAQIEQYFIEKALKRHGGNRENAARDLGIHRATLYRKIKSYGIDA